MTNDFEHIFVLISYSYIIFVKTYIFDLPEFLKNSVNEFFVSYVIYKYFLPVCILSTLS